MKNCQKCPTCHQCTALHCSVGLISFHDRRSISTSDLFSRPCLEEPEQKSSCLANSSPHKLDPVLEEEKKGEEEKEEEEEGEGREEKEVKGEKKKGDSCKGREDAAGEIRTFCESLKPGEIEGKPCAFNAAGADGGGVENAEVQKENNPPAAAESSQLEKKSRLCTGVEVHR